MTAIQDRLETAIETVDAELAAVGDERAAFEAFRSAVDRVEVHQPSTDVSPPTIQAVGRADADPMARLRNAYRETVMDTPDYEEAYGDRLVEHVAAELSADAATILCADQPPPGFKEQLRDEIADATARRGALIEALETERDALRSAAGDLAEIESELADLEVCSTASMGVEMLSRTWRRLDRLEDRCGSVAHRRQRGIAARRTSAGSGTTHTLNTYLYDGLECTFPVLYSVTRLHERIRAHKNGYQLE